MPDINELFLPVLALVDTDMLDFVLTLLSFLKA
jgi:hypothetical protein